MPHLILLVIAIDILLMGVTFILLTRMQQRYWKMGFAMLLLTFCCSLILGILFSVYSVRFRIF